MRLKAGIVAAALAAATTVAYVGPASAQQGVGPNCDDFPTQIDIANSIFPDDLDPTDLDSDDGVGCQSNPGPPVAYDLTQSPPVAIADEPLDVSPTSGPPGTVITVRGEECVGEVGETVAAEVGLLNETAQQFVPGGRAVPAAADGSWSVQLSVPAGADPGDAFVVVANCFVTDTDELIFRYERVDFDVTPLLPLEVQPTGGPVGTVVTVSGAGCLGPSGRPGTSADFRFTDGTSLEDSGGFVSELNAGPGPMPAEDGTWSGVFEVPAQLQRAGGAEVIDVVPGGDYFVTAVCVILEGDTPMTLQYEIVDFEVTAAAAPARPVVAKPTFTG